MNTLLLLALFALLVWLLYLGRALLAWVLPLGLGLLIWYLRAGEITAGLWVSGVVFAGLVVGLLAPPVRRLLLTSRLMPTMAPLFPELGDEERAVLETGAVGWDGELFRGAPDWRKLLELKVPELEPSSLEAESPPGREAVVGDERLAPIGGLTYLIEAARRLFAAERATVERPVVASAIGEIYLTAAAQRVVELGVGKPDLSPSAPPQDAAVATRSTSVFERAELLAHPYARAEREAVAEKDTKGFDRAICGHLGYFVSNFTRASFLAWSGGRFAASPIEGRAERTFEHYSQLSAAFAVCADVTAAGLGDARENEARLNARLADALAWLYLGSAALKRWVDEGQPERDEPLWRWATEYALFRVQEALLALLDNLPGRRTAWTLRWKLFPVFARFRAPGDALEREVARRLREDQSA